MLLEKNTVKKRQVNKVQEVGSSNISEGQLDYA